MMEVEGRERKGRREGRKGEGEWRGRGGDDGRGREGREEGKRERRKGEGKRGGREHATNTLLTPWSGGWCIGVLHVCLISGVA